MAEPDAQSSGPKLICRCFRVSEAAIRKAIASQPLRTVEQVTACTRAAGGCSSCYDDVAAILAEIHGTVRPAVPAPAERTHEQLRALVLETFAAQIRPLFALNGVEMEILDVHGERIFTRFRGAAAGSQRPGILTLKWYLVTIMSSVCGRKMQQVEVNVLQDEGVSTLP